jgi:PIN domain nuclease of toxin-antitoxin system
VDELVIDASAVLAAVNGEAGSERVAAAIPGVAISAPNLSEVVAKLCESGLDEGEIREVLSAFGFEVHAFDEELAWQAGLLRPATRSAGLGLGDRACLALARKLDRPALTADRAWSSLRLPVAIELLR